MKRYLPVTLVVAGLLTGVALLLLALDIARAERELQRDDTRFLAQPRVPGYWASDGVLPFDLGRRVLGVQDDVEARQAVQRFWRVHPRDNTPPTISPISSHWRAGLSAPPSMRDISSRVPTSRFKRSASSASVSSICSPTALFQGTSCCRSAVAIPLIATRGVRRSCETEESRADFK